MRERYPILRDISASIRTRRTVEEAELALKLEGEWSQFPHEKEVLWDLGQQFETVAVERTTRAALPALLGAPAVSDGPAKEVVVVTLKAVDRFHDLVLDLFADGGSLEEAERVVRLRLEREARRHGPESAEVAECWHSLGTVFGNGGAYDHALELSPPYVWLKFQRSIMSWPLSHEHMQIWYPPASVRLASQNER